MLTACGRGIGYASRWHWIVVIRNSCGLQIYQRVLISWAMCGRYDNLMPRDAYGVLFRATRIPRLNFPPRYNIAPTDQIPIVRIDPRDGERELVMALGSHPILDERQA
jgi:hypothetical protein